MSVKLSLCNKIIPVSALLMGLLASPLLLAEKSAEAVIFSKRFDLTESKAYQIQKAFVKNSIAKGAIEIGYKAGLTNAAAQKKFGIAEPISGVLLSPPARKGAKNTVFNLNDNYQLMIEIELAFRLKKNISKVITADEVETYIANFAPAIELPDMSFKETGFTGNDIIANNALAYDYIVGDSVEDISRINDITVSILCNGEKLTSGVSSVAMGDQKRALLWLINNLVDNGYSLRKGQVLLTGNLAAMLEAKPCDYVAKYSGLSDIQFTVQ